ncbi:MoaD/ThiS family protein [Methylophaga pinxianii]|uniref:MoaD/ThiS family protein n=1 Tax=Methylophaga pinxianii TaxID=2881052 RepID=UPI001CF3E145|nr:MoaD/ThiS family protein [Methylophaga pinxianii]MCB2427259.1 MoaD/ThiS family protein [Methylophaga pinxianii]UPH46473.1 MoaD/ThiS family protein [Methylophaga pinxianii]
MSIQVKFFASLRETLGQSETTVEDAVTVAEVWDMATQSATPPNNLLVAVNLDYATLQSPVKEGDEVAFFPPVTGG